MFLQHPARHLQAEGARIKATLFLAQLWVHGNIERKVGRVLADPRATVQPPLPSTCLPAVRLLQGRSHTDHAESTVQPGVTLGVVRSLGLDRAVKMRVHHMGSWAASLP